MAGGDPSDALQGAIYQALIAAGWPNDILGTGDVTDRFRVFDRITPTQTAGTNITGNVKAAFPYLQLGEVQVIGDFADCVDGSEVFFDVHVWSQAVGYPECKQLASIVRATLHEAELELDGFNVVDIQFQDTRYIRDPDGITSHAVVNFRALIDATD